MRGSDRTKIEMNAKHNSDRKQKKRAALAALSL